MMPPGLPVWLPPKVPVSVGEAGLDTSTISSLPAASIRYAYRPDTYTPKPALAVANEPTVEGVAGFEISKILSPTVVPPIAPITYKYFPETKGVLCVSAVLPGTVIVLTAIGAV